MTERMHRALVVGPGYEDGKKQQQAVANLAQEGVEMHFATSQHEAAIWLCENEPSVVLIDLSLEDGSPLAVANFCSYRRPEARVVLRGNGQLFSDGSIFSLIDNVHALVADHATENDLSALLSFHATARRGGVRDEGSAFALH
ncbi:VpsR-related response regulator [uncultured Jannaschia sp.]|uniref:VpsR-related response regulator n=1 Tax=uncultured Jannaschia sp. TaxID=293347 RepID=UPI002603EC7C|nr:VpsR-related response regulator [uncultured Jannaschia sp.]